MSRVHRTLDGCEVKRTRLLGDKQILILLRPKQKGQEGQRLQMSLDEYLSKVKIRLATRPVVSSPVSSLGNQAQDIPVTAVTILGLVIVFAVLVLLHLLV